MIPKKTREALLSGDESERKSALGSIKNVDSRDIDFLVETAWSFDPSHLQTVVEQIGKVRNKESAGAISAILFACTEKSQEAIRIKCIDALAENPTGPATQALLNVAMNEKFYRTQCHAVRKLGTRQPEQRILILLHGIVEAGPRTPMSDEEKGDPHRLVLHAFEALTSESLGNPESAEVILNKIGDPGCEEYYRQEGIKHLAKTGFPSLVDSALDKLEEHLENDKVVFPLCGLLAELRQTRKQRIRVQEAVEVLLGKTRPTQAMNPHLVRLMKAALDENLIDVVTKKTSTWELNGPAGSPIVELLNACPKTKVSTVTALLRYAESPQWSGNKGRVLPNLKEAYRENGKAVVRSLFESDRPAYRECRDYLRQQYNTPADRENLVANIREGIEAFVAAAGYEAERFERHLSEYFRELRNILPPLLKDSISDQAWQLATDRSLYPLIKLVSKCELEQRSALGGELSELIDDFLSNPTTGSQFVDRSADDWLVRRKRSAAKYVLNQACVAEKHRKSTIQIVVCRAARFFHKGEAITHEEGLFQKWVSQNVVGRWKTEAKSVLEGCLVEKDEFNPWAYDSLRVHDLLGPSVITRGLASKIAEAREIELLQDLVANYTPNAEAILVQKIRHGRTAGIRACATKTAGAVFDYSQNPTCPNSVLDAIHERFTEQSKDVREVAYASLGKIRSEQSIDPLSQVRTKDKRFRGIIEESLNCIFERFADAKPDESNVETTIAWIEVIGKLGDVRGFELLKPYVDSSSYHREQTVRKATIEAMGRVGSSDHIPFLQELKKKEEHVPDLIDEIDRAVARISNVGDFELLDIMRKLTDGHPAFDSPVLDLTRLFIKRTQVLKNQCFKAYKAWHGEEYSLYATRLDCVCDLVAKTLLEVFREELFGEDDKKFVSVSTSESPDTRYNFIKARFDKVIGSCFNTVHALRVKAPEAHPEDAKTGEPRAELLADDAGLAKDNFISAVTKSVKKLREKVLLPQAPSTP